MLLCLSGAVCLFPPSHSLLRRAVTTLSQPLRQGAAWMGERAEAVGSYLTGYDQLKRENEELKEQLAAQEEALRRGERAEEENRRLRTLLRLRDSQGERELEPARVLCREQTPWHDSLTLTIGGDSLAQPGDWVITEHNALVGQVSETGPGWATVGTVLDPETEVSVILSESGEVGLAAGSLEGLTAGVLTVSGLRTSGGTKPGDRVETSGLNGLCEGDLLVGTVESLSLSGGGLEKSATVTPAAALDNLGEVFLLVEGGTSP